MTAPQPTVAGRALRVTLHLTVACALAGVAAGRHPGLTAWRHGGKGGLDGCILMLDDRYTPALAARNLTRPEDADGMPYYEAAFHINRLYAQRHGYAFAFHGPGDYLAAGGDRHVAWKKVQHLRDQLECCCQWALWMDSDSFLVMQQHALSVEGWVSLNSRDSARMITLLGNMHLSKGLSDGADPVAAVSTNEPHELGPQPFCTSNMLFTRTRRSIEILDFWYNATAGVHDLTEFLFEFPWEQAPFNYLVSRKFSEAIEPFPVGQVQGWHSEFIQNVNHYMVTERTYVPAEHLKEVLSRRDRA